MPLLTHEDGDATTIAPQPTAVALAERPAERSDAGRRTRSAARKAATPWRRIRRILYVLLGLGFLSPFLAFFIGWLMFPVPSAEEATLSQVATFTYADGSPLATVRPENGNRVFVSLDKVPKHVRDAVLAAEDRTFYSNPGFDIMGIGRAVWNQLTGGVGGGSTITQQYVKVSTGQDESSLWRKYKEVILAVKISNELTKDEILENYLNTIYLGRGAYGIQAAAKAYFNKDVEQLSVSEGAMLAGIIQSPSRWDPAKNLEQAQGRWNFALDGMAEQGWISQADRAAQTFPQWLPEAPSSGGMPDDNRFHVYEKAVEELARHGITQDQISTEGLTVTTTVDPARQQAAEQAVNKIMRNQPDNLRSALVSVDPRTGAIVAYYGGNNGLGTDYAMALRQPGSSFKPFVLAAALESGEGIGLGSMYDGSSPQQFEGGVTVDNSEGFNCPQCSVKTAMTRSINTIFYRMALDVGASRVIDAAHQAGIPADLLPEARGGIALGDQEVHPVDMASAFATFAADGVRHEPYIVSRVVAADGRVLYERDEAEGQQAFPQQVARNVSESMMDVASSSGIALSGGRPVASKTGTVQHPTQDGQNKDAWTVGFTPSISTAVWVGSDQSDPIRDSRGRPIYGRMVPGQIWQEFMNAALRGQPTESFSRFVPLGVPPTSDPVESPSDDDEEQDEDEDSDRRRSDDDEDSDDSGGLFGRSDSDSNSRRSSDDRDSRSGEPASSRGRDRSGDGGG